MDLTNEDKDICILKSAEPVEMLCPRKWVFDILWEFFGIDTTLSRLQTKGGNELYSFTAFHSAVDSSASPVYIRKPDAPNKGWFSMSKTMHNIRDMQLYINVLSMQISGGCELTTNIREENGVEIPQAETESELRMKLSLMGHTKSTKPEI